MIVFYAVGIDVALFDFIATYDWQPQKFTKLPGKSGFARSRPARNDDALWFSVHVSEWSTLRFSGWPTQLNNEACEWRVRDQSAPLLFGLYRFRNADLRSGN